METQNQENTNPSIRAGITTTMLSIPAHAASQVLRSIHNNGIQNKYLGLDQSGRLLMEIVYENQQKQLIEDITKYMQQSEAFVAEFSQIINQTIEKMSAEADKTLKEKIEKFERSRKEREKRKKETVSNGEQHSK